MATNGTRPDRTALILYGTETGTAQDIAEEAARILERLYFTTDVIGLDNVSIVRLKLWVLKLAHFLFRLIFHHAHSAFSLSPLQVKGTSHPTRDTFGKVC